MDQHPDQAMSTPLPLCRLTHVHACPAEYGGSGCSFRLCAVVDPARTPVQHRAPVAEGFGPWLQDHFEVHLLAEDVPVIRCRRCGEWVGYPAMHAARRHGDPVLIGPVVKDAPLQAINACLW